MPVLAALLALFPGGQYPPEQNFESFQAPFVKKTCKDRFGRTITYYLSKGEGKLPLALFISGSGGQSMWVIRQGNLYGGLPNLLNQVGEGKVRVLAVEKPGIPFGFQPPRPGTAEGTPEEFLREHTLERWAEANSAALKDAWKRRDVDRDRTLVAGHSEGGIVAARVAAENPKVTHLGVLAGGGPNQLHDLTQLLPSGAPAVFTQWKEIQQDPTSTAKFAWGHPYRRWSSFLSTSTLDETLQSKAKVFIAQGTHDRNVLPSGAEILNAELTARGRSVVYERVVGGDHSFIQSGDSTRADGLRSIFRNLVGWFLAPSPNSDGKEVG